MKLLTNLLFEPKGRHDSSLAYSIKDTVMSTDGSKVYFALQDVPAGIALTNEDYWILQVDLSASKAAMDEVVANFADYAKQVGTKVRGETAHVTGNPVTFLPDAGSLLQPVTVLDVKQEGSGDPAPGGKNLMPRRAPGSQTISGVTVTVNADNSVSIKGTATANALYRFVGAEDALVIPSGAFTVSMGTAFPSGVSVACEYFNGTTWGGNYDALYVASGKRTFNAVAGTNYGMYMSIASGKTVDFTVYPQIEIGSEATSYSPPENIRPIAGYDKLELNRVGENRYNVNFKIEELVNTYIYGKLPIYGIPGSVWSWSLPGNAFKGSGAYCILTSDINFTGGTSAGSLHHWIGVGGENSANSEFGTFIVPETGVFYVAILNGTRDVARTLTQKLMLVEGRYTADTIPEWKPYAGNPYTVQIGQTVYGGRFDWLTGKLYAEWAVKTLDGTENFSHYNGWANKYAYYRDGLMNDAVNIADNNTVADILCSHAVTDTPNNFTLNAYSGAFVGQGVGTRLYICLGEHATADELKAEIAAQNAAGTPVQIVYKLAKPVEIQLTPHVISAADPEQTNTLYGDGTIETTYVKPLHVSIEERVAAIASAMLMKEE